MEKVTLKIANPTKAQKEKAHKVARSTPVANRAKSVTYTLANGKQSIDPRALIVRERVLLATFTKESVEVTDLFIRDLPETEYAANRAPLYHIPHRTFTNYEGANTMKVTAFVNGTISENKKARTITGLASTRGDLVRVFITLA